MGVSYKNMVFETVLLSSAATSLCVLAVVRLSSLCVKILDMGPRRKEL